MARPGWPERNRAVRSFRQLRRFHHVINSDKVFGTHTCPAGDLGQQPQRESPRPGRLQSEKLTMAKASGSSSARGSGSVKRCCPNFSVRKSSAPAIAWGNTCPSYSNLLITYGTPLLAKTDGPSMR